MLARVMLFPCFLIPTSCSKARLLRGHGRLFIWMYSGGLHYDGWMLRFLAPKCVAVPERRLEEGLVGAGIGRLLGDNLLNGALSWRPAHP